tara:strand:- start:74 stop:565 length:492 start_codon:yes stop_codon:yes gene_type:complete
MCIVDKNCSGVCCIDAYYKCSSECYEITDFNGNSIHILSTHNIISTCKEINHKNRIKYSNCCFNHVIIPVVYDTTVNKFKTDDGEIIEYYDNFLEDNIIHTFINTPCEHCSDIFKKAYFIVGNNIIKIYDENNNLLKINDIETSMEDFFSKLTSDISKKNIIL